MKKVSIIIPVYNGSNYVKEAIDSALAQTYKNIEIIVVNDGSKDNDATKNIALSYKDKIKYYEKENGGASSALNYGISKMTGDYFSWLSHDDLYYPNKIERQINELEKYDDNTILYSNFDYIDQNGIRFDTITYDHQLLKEKPDYAVLKGCISGITLLIPKHILDEIGPFREDLRCVQDYEMWFRMLPHCQFVHMDEVLTMTRIHSKQDTQTSPKMISEGNWLWKHIIKDYEEEKKIEYEGSSYLFYQSMEDYLLKSPYKEALDYTKKQKEESIKEYSKSLNQSITIIIIGNKDEKEIKKTIHSIEKQSYQKYQIMIEGFKLENYQFSNSREESLKLIDTDYYTFLTGGTEVQPNWLEEQLMISNLTKKALVISDYPRPNYVKTIDLLTGLILPLDGIIMSSNYKPKYEYDYGFLYDIASIGGSIIVEKSYLLNRREEYDMDSILKYQLKVIKDGKCNNFELASLNYDITCLYNKYGKSSYKVFMYEPCNQLREMMFSRIFQYTKKYMDWKKKKSKKL